MSELKAFDITVAEEGYCEGIVKYRRAVYDKSEADKVIAELKADYKEACDRLQNANLIKDEQLEATRNQKYKRCLAMASNCRLRARWFGDNAFYKKEQWALQWHRRWLEIAEEFKEAK